MDATNNRSDNKPQQQHKQHGNAYALAVAGDDATDDDVNKQMKKAKYLSSSDGGGGEPEENYRGWKAMPYVIGTFTCTASSLLRRFSVYNMSSSSSSSARSFGWWLVLVCSERKSTLVWLLVAVCSERKVPLAGR
jgi:hypothetical protein